MLENCVGFVTCKLLTAIFVLCLAKHVRKVPVSPYTPRFRRHPSGCQVPVLKPTSLHTLRALLVPTHVVRVQHVLALAAQSQFFLGALVPLGC